MKTAFYTALVAAVMLGNQTQAIPLSATPQNLSQLDAGKIYIDFFGNQYMEQEDMEAGLLKFETIRKDFFNDLELEEQQKACADAWEFATKAKKSI